MRRHRSIEFAALEVLVTLAESSSFSEAAKRLRISQSAVSQAIRQLERATSSNLVVRRSSPLQFTRSGEHLLKYAHGVLKDTTNIVNVLASSQEQKIAQLNIGMIDSFADSLALPVVTDLDEVTHRVSLTTGMNASLTDAFLSRNLDLLITADLKFNGKDCLCLPLIRDPFVVITPAKYRRQTLTNLAAKLPFIHYSPESTIGGQTDIIARRLNLKLNTQYEFDSTQLVIRFVQQHHGWAILSALCLVRYAELLDGVSVINLEQGKHAREISLIARRNEWQSLPTRLSLIARRAFDDTLKPKLKTIRPWLTRQAYSLD